jgi:hypothetical protein
MKNMGRFLLGASLFVMLGGSVWYAFTVWSADDGPPMSPDMYIAMGLGIVFSLVIGCGLMALVFYSHRHGYDERVQSDHDAL